jgi:hypothetical protein
MFDAKEKLLQGHDKAEVVEMLEHGIDALQFFIRSIITTEDEMK